MCRGLTEEAILFTEGHENDLNKWRHIPMPLKKYWLQVAKNKSYELERK